MRKLSLTTDLIASWHVKHCSALDEFADRYGYAHGPGVERPGIRLSLLGARWAGKYNSTRNFCLYSVPYACLIGDDFEQVVAHECSHAYAQQLMPGSRWHGELWELLMTRVCGVPAQAYHRYDVKLAQAVSAVLRARVRSHGPRAILKV